MQENIVEEKTDIIGSADQSAGKPRFFTDPRPVKHKTRKHIIIFQTAVCLSVCLFIKLCGLMSPQLYENILTYLRRLFLW